ncbi:MAG: indole-3-glycerol phosphate synthase TrpC [Nitrososphaeraceae archaeon]
MYKRSRYNNDFVKQLASNSFKSIDEGMYDLVGYYNNHDSLDLKTKIIESTKNIPIITEIKFSSPSKGKIKNQKNVNLLSIPRQMIDGGAIGLSILTQKYLFDGSIENFLKIRKNIPVPLLMKDIIVSEVQIDAAKKIGADYILLIKTIFDKNLAEGSLDKFTDYARNKGLNILYEVHHENEFNEILNFNMNKKDLIGINNRNLNNLKINLTTTEILLKKFNKGNRIIISESGINTSEDIQYLKKIGADAFLIGTSIMESDDIYLKVQELVNANI